MSARSGSRRPVMPFRHGERERMAQALGCHPNTLSAYLGGSRTTPLSKAVALLQMPEVRRAGFVLEHFTGTIPRDIPIWCDDDASAA